MGTYGRADLEQNATCVHKKCEAVVKRRSEQMWVFWHGEKKLSPTTELCQSLRGEAERERCR